MTTLDKSLRCLRHPVTLFSLALLLLNDHVLKAAAPGWLTGKLSDVAGLFFCPFVLAALMGLVFERLDAPPRRVGAAAFGLTTLWFALVKLCPWGNALTERLVAALSGLPSAIILDPTDLLALPVLWFAWKLWDREEATARRAARLDWALLGLASLASLATSCIPQPIIDRVVHVDGVIYVRAVPFIDRGPLRDGTLARSDDSGQTWTVIEDVPAELDHEVTLPLVVCDPADPLLCFRITGEEQVEESRDGGQMWQVAWKIPAGRDRYRLRARMASLSPCATYGYEPGTRDMIALHTDDGLQVVVAAGSEGVLVRDSKGRWKYHGVLGANPDPLGGNPLAVLWELVGLIPVAIFAGFILLVVGWWTLVRAARHQQQEHSPWWPMIPITYPILLAILCGVLAALGIKFATDWLILAVGVLAPIVFPILPLFSLEMVWGRLKKVAPRPERIAAANRASLRAGLRIWLWGWAPFVLWALGVIPLYGIALGLAVLIVLAWLVWSARIVRRLARWAVTPEAISPEVPTTEGQP